MTDSLRCLAIRQPYAWAVCAGAKDIENRTWSTKYRGPVVIVASSTKAEVNRLQRAARPRGLPDLPFAYGAAIGLVDLIDVRPLDARLESNPWVFGPYCWELANARFLKTPVPCKAKLKLYSPDEDLLTRVRPQISTAHQIRLDGAMRAWVEAARDEPEENRFAAHVESYTALDDCQNVLRLVNPKLKAEPENEFLRWHRGLALFWDGDVEDALKEFMEYVRLTPDDAGGYFWRGACHECLGHQDKANRDFKRAKELDPYFDREELGP